jgi:hypothetical protein
VGSLADWSFDAARAEIAFKSSGVRVFVYRPGDLEGNAIVKRGKPHAWVAEMIVETIRHPDDEGYTNGRGPDAAAKE